MLKSCAAVLLVYFGVVSSLGAQTFSAQGAAGGRKPVMENVFFNVVWGSVLGGVLGAAGAVIQAERKTAPEGIKDGVGIGTTYGGIIGLGVGLWLGFSAISFDPQRSLFFSMHGTAPPSGLAGGFSPPLVFETAGPGSLRITGFRARVFDFRF